MGAHNLTLHSIQHLDGGKVDVAFTHAVAQVVADIKDRPGDKTKRTVTLTLSATPTLADDGSGVLDTIETRFQVKTGIPVRKSRGYPMAPRQDGKAMLFQEEDPNNPHQQTFPYDPVAKAGEAGGDEDDEIDQDTGEVIGAADDDADDDEVNI